MDLAACSSFKRATVEFLYWRFQRQSIELFVSGANNACGHRGVRALKRALCANRCRTPSPRLAPFRAPPYSKPQSTIIMPCNYSGFTDPASTVGWSIIDFGELRRRRRVVD